MANTLTNTDVYTVINSMAEQMYGAEAITAVDTTTFVTIGESMLRTGYESTLNALSTVIGRSITAIRPYKSKFNIVSADSMRFGQILRKISYFTSDFEQSQDWATNLNVNALKDGATVDHYKIKKRYPLEINFCGNKVLQTHVTRFRKQLRQAFRSEADFAAFYEGVAIEVANELEAKREAESRALVLNHIGAVYTAGTAAMKRNLTKEYNTEFGTSYTTAELLGAHLNDFLAFFVSTVKKTVELLEENTELYHLTPVKTDDSGNTLKLLRHTPRSMQKLVLNKNFIFDAEARVLPTIFNGSYLKLDNYEGVMFWQSPSAPYEVNIKPNYLDVTTGQSKDAAAAVNLKHVLGMIFDRDALNMEIHADDVITTPVNAAGDYYNTYYHWAKQYNDDLTENTVLFYMADDEV